MSPYQFLLLTIGMMAAGVVANLLHRRARQRALAGLARQWQLHYSPRDVFRLASRIAPRLPEPGAADVVVCDVIYGIEDSFHRYLFSVEYTLGVIRAKRRVVRVATFREPREHSDPGAPPSLELADESLPLTEQYRTLRQRHVAVPASAA